MATEDGANSGSVERSNVGDEFMLAEFENMRYFHEEDTSISERRVDVLLAVTSGMAAGLALLAQTGIDAQFLLTLAIVGCVGLLLIGVPTFFDTLRRDVNAVDYIHALNAVREYFAMRAPAIVPYLLEPTYRHFPRYGSLSSSRRASAVLNSLAAAALDVALRMLAFHQRRPDIGAAIVGIAVMLLAFGAHWLAWRAMYQGAADATKESGSLALNEARKAQARANKEAARGHNSTRAANVQDDPAKKA
ncbi:MAG TPA: hypothetical protein VF808_13615 [Ktedonobacterales bacterium]